jgi:hypothetical protein
VKEPLEIAIAALEAVTDPKQSSMRIRDPNCVRFIASDALDRINKLGLDVGGLRWTTHTIEGPT